MEQYHTYASNKQETDKISQQISQLLLHDLEQQMKQDGTGTLLLSQFVELSSSTPEYLVYKVNQFLFRNNILARFSHWFEKTTSSFKEDNSCCSLFRFPFATIIYLLRNARVILEQCEPFSRSPFTFISVKNDDASIHRRNLLMDCFRLSCLVRDELGTYCHCSSDSACHLLDMVGQQHHLQTTLRMMGAIFEYGIIQYRSELHDFHAVWRHIALCFSSTSYGWSMLYDMIRASRQPCHCPPPTFLQIEVDLFSQEEDCRPPSMDGIYELATTANQLSIIDGFYRPDVLPTYRRCNREERYELLKHYDDPILQINQRWAIRRIEPQLAAHEISVEADEWSEPPASALWSPSDQDISNHDVVAVQVSKPASSTTYLPSGSEFCQLHLELAEWSVQQRWIESLPTVPVKERLEVVERGHLYALVQLLKTVTVELRERCTDHRSKELSLQRYGLQASHWESMKQLCTDVPLKTNLRYHAFILTILLDVGIYCCPGCDTMSDELDAISQRLDEIRTQLSSTK